MNIFEVMTKIAEKAAQTSMWEGGILNCIDEYILIYICVIVRDCKANTSNDNGVSQEIIVKIIII